MTGSETRGNTKSNSSPFLFLNQCSHVLAAHTFCLWAFVYRCPCVRQCSYRTACIAPKKGLERWGCRWEKKRQSGIIVTDKSCTLMGYALRCLSPNQPQSINHLPQPVSPINQLGATPTEGLPGPCCLVQVTSANQVSQHQARPTSDYLGRDSIFKVWLINVNALLVKTNLLYIHVIFLSWQMKNAGAGGPRQVIIQNDAWLSEINNVAVKQHFMLPCPTLFPLCILNVSSLAYLFINF